MNRRPAASPRPRASSTRNSATWWGRSRSAPYPAARSRCPRRRRRRAGPTASRSPTPRFSPGTSTRTSAAGPRSPPAATARAASPRRHGAGPRPRRSAGRWLAPAARSGWRDLPASVTATTGTSPDGRRVHIVHNWSWEPASVPAPVDLSDALTGTSVFAGSALHLGPWDVRFSPPPTPRRPQPEVTAPPDALPWPGPGPRSPSMKPRPSPHHEGTA